MALRVLQPWRVCAARSAVERAEEGLRRKQQEEKTHVSGWYQQSIARSDRFLQAWSRENEEKQRNEVFARCFVTWALSMKEMKARRLLRTEEDRLLQALDTQRRKEDNIRGFWQIRSCTKRALTLQRSVASTSFALWEYGAAIVRYRQRRDNLATLRISVVERILEHQVLTVFRHVIVFSWRRIASGEIVAVLEERERELEDVLSSLPSMSSRSDTLSIASEANSSKTSSTVGTVLVPGSTPLLPGRGAGDDGPPTLRGKYEATKSPQSVASVPGASSASSAASAVSVGDPQMQAASPARRLLQQAMAPPQEYAAARFGSPRGKANTGMLDLDEFAAKLSKFNFGVSVS